jgi:hypothetical protein
MLQEFSTSPCVGKTFCERMHNGQLGAEVSAAAAAAPLPLQANAQQCPGMSAENKKGSRVLLTPGSRPHSCAACHCHARQAHCQGDQPPRVLELTKHGQDGGLPGQQVHVVSVRGGQAHFATKPRHGEDGGALTRKEPESEPAFSTVLGGMTSTGSPFCMCAGAGV